MELSVVSSVLIDSIVRSILHECMGAMPTFFLFPKGCLELREGSC